MSLADFATELINDAKTSSEAEETVFKLDQLKEVVLHREVALLPEVFPAAVELMTRPSVKIKKFLVKFAAESISRSAAVITDFISLYSFFVEESHDVIRRAVVVQLSRVYDKAAMAVVNMSSDKGRAATAKVMNTWDSLHTLITKCIDLISAVPSDAPGSDQFRTEILKLSEAVVYFGFPAGQHSDSGGSSAGAHGQYHKHTVADIPLNHPHMNRDAVERETEALYSKLVLWLTRGGSASSHFTSSLLFILASTVAKIVTDRPSAPRMLSSAKALTVYLAGVNRAVNSGEVTADSIDLLGRENISKSIHRLLTSAAGGASVSERADYSKLKGVLDAFDAETLSRNTAAVVSDPRKRGRAAPRPKPGPGPVAQTNAVVAPAALHLSTEDVDVSEQVHQSALAAVDQMQAKLKQKASVNAVTTAAVSAAAAVTGALAADGGDSVEFGWDIFRDISGGSTLAVQDLTQNKLISLQLQQKSEISVKSMPIMINVVENQYQNLGLFSLENYISQLVSLKLPRSRANASTLALAAAAIGSEGEDGSEVVSAVSEEETKTIRLMNALCIKLSLSLCEVVALGLKSGEADLGDVALVALRSKNSKMFVTLCIYALPGSISSLFLENPFAAPSSGSSGAGARSGLDGTNAYLFLAAAFKQVPSTVELPKPLWLFISMFLVQAETVARADYTQATAAAETAAATATTYRQRQAAIEASKITISEAAAMGDGSVLVWVDVLLQLVMAVFHREDRWRSLLGEQGIAGAGDGEADGAGRLYDQLCLVILSRLLQRRALRSLAAYFIESLPLVPMGCVRYLNMVLYMGGRLYASDQGTRDKTVRQEACSILGKLVTSYYEFTLSMERQKQREARGEEAGGEPPPPGVDKVRCDEVIRGALYSLLWCSVSSAEIDVRATATSTLTANVVPFLSATSWVLRAVYVFSVQAAVGVLGAGKLRNWVFKQRAQVPPPPEEEGLYEEGEEEVEAMEVEEEPVVKGNTKAVVEEAGGAAGATVSVVPSESDGADEDAAAVEGVEEEEEEEFVYEGPDVHFPSLLYQSLDEYDLGLSFATGGGPFVPLSMEMLLRSTQPEAEVLEAVERYTRLHLNLLLQLCLADMNLLFPVVNLYGSVTYFRQQLVFQSASTVDGVTEESKAKLQLQMKILDVVLSCTQTVFESTIHAVVQKHRQTISPAPAVPVPVVASSAMDSDAPEESSPDEPEAELPLMDAFLRDLMRYTDVFACRMVFSVLDTVYAVPVDTPVVGAKRPDTVVSEHSVRFVAEYVGRVRTSMGVDLAVDADWEEEELDECEVLARKRQRSNNRLLLLPLLVEGTSLTLADGAQEDSLALIMGLFEAKLRTALLNGYAREMLESRILPDIFRYFPPATKSGVKPAAASSADATAAAETKAVVSSFYPPDTVKRAFIKLVRFKGSPPNVLPATVAPLSKVQLLVFLHQ